MPKLITMEATLKFNLPDESGEFEIAVKAQAMHSVLWEFNQFIWGEMKYNNYTDEEYKIAEIYRDKFREILQENNISLDQ